MKKICVVTSTRAEYGVLKNTIQRIEEDADLELKLVVTGTHVVKEYGNTIDEIKKDGFPICEIIQIMEPEKGCTVIKTMSSALERFGKCFVSMRPDLLVVVGDRYEIMAICEAAMVLKIPIAHISGGEITEGAIDDTIRHCSTYHRDFRCTYSRWRCYRGCSGRCNTSLHHKDELPSFSSLRNL